MQTRLECVSGLAPIVRDGVTVAPHYRHTANGLDRLLSAEQGLAPEVLTKKALLFTPFASSSNSSTQPRSIE